jgi:riboflavin synthase
MFSGIVRAVSEVKKSEMRNGSLVLTVATPSGWQVKLGDSISTSGVCLTVSAMGEGWHEYVLVPETLSKTFFGKKVPAQVNLEQSLRMGDPMDGHVVQGHVDTTGSIVNIISEGDSKRCEIEFPAAFAKFVALKGSIAVDGVSLTVAEFGANRLTVALIPHTLSSTTLSERRVGDLVNLEFDIMAKQLARIQEAK